MSLKIATGIKVAWVIITLCAPSGAARSQNTQPETMDVERFSETILSTQDEDLDYEALYENLAQTLSTPLDVNTATAEEFWALHILTDSQIENLITWRAEHGALLDVYELQVIPEFDRDAISKLLPFIKVRNATSRLDKTLLHRIFSNGNSYVMARYERTLAPVTNRDTADGNTFAGSPDKLFLRTRSNIPGDFSVGMTGEKDAGEQMRIDRHQLAFDFTSFHFQVRDKGPFRNLIAGDFQVQFGQGLMLGGAFGMGKGGESISALRKSSLGFQPYNSIHEAAYQRGLAMTLRLLRHVDISMFYSNAKRDATARAEGDSMQVHSLLTTGLHRTQKELRTRRSIREQNAGLIINIRNKKLDAGLVANLIRFDSELRKKPALYNRFAFAGNSNLNAGFFLNYRFDNVSFFSETAKSVQGGFGTLLGLLVSAHKNIDLALLYRYYSPDLYTFNANAFAENSTPQNERGFFWSWKYQWNRRCSMNGYVDLFMFPWLGFRRYSPSTGHEWLLRGNYRPSRDVSVFLHVREESKPLNLPGTMTVYNVGVRTRRNISFNLDYGAGPRIRMRSRIQYSAQDFDQTLTEGWAFAQDITVRLGRLEFSGRHSLFDTDTYDNRHYLYERDAWSSYSLPAYTGTGVRNYALVEYKISQQLTVWLRYARTRTLSAGEIGGGQDTGGGNTRNDVKFQARFTF